MRFIVLFTFALVFIAVVNSTCIFFKKNGKLFDVQDDRTCSAWCHNEHGHGGVCRNNHCKCSPRIRTFFCKYRTSTGVLVELYSTGVCSRRCEFDQQRRGQCVNRECICNGQYLVPPGA